MDAKGLYPRKLGGVRCNKGRPEALCLARDEEIVSTDWRAGGSKRGPDATRVLGILKTEIDDLDRAPCERQEALTVELWASALRDAIPEFKQDYGRGCNLIALLYRSFETPPNRLRSSIDQGDASVCVQQEGQSKTSREGVTG